MFERSLEAAERFRTRRQSRVDRRTALAIAGQRASCRPGSRYHPERLSTARSLQGHWVDRPREGTRRRAHRERRAEHPLPSFSEWTVRSQPSWPVRSMQGRRRAELHGAVKKRIDGVFAPCDFTRQTFHSRHGLMAVPGSLATALPNGRRAVDSSSRSASGTASADGTGAECRETVRNPRRPEVGNGAASFPQRRFKDAAPSVGTTLRFVDQNCEPSADTLTEESQRRV